MLKEGLTDALGTYFEEVAGLVPEKPLLNHAQEIKLGQKIEAGRLAQEDLNGDHLSETVNEAQKARDILAESNLRLVIDIAGQFSSRQPWIFGEMVQVGNLGLMKAVDKYDWRKGSRFYCYATYWIRREIRNSLRERCSLSVGDYGAYCLSRVKRQREIFFDTKGFYPNDEQTAELTGFSADKIASLLKADQLAVPLHSPLFDDENSQLVEDVLSDANQNELPEPVMLQNQRREKIKVLLQEYLNPREEKILTLRFGLKDGYCHTLEEIGGKFGLTRERIRQIIEEAFETIRQPEILEKFKQVD